MLFFCVLFSWLGQILFDTPASAGDRREASSIEPEIRIFYDNKGEYREWKKKISCTWKAVWVN